VAARGARATAEVPERTDAQKGPVMKWIAGPVALRQRLDHLEALSAQSSASSHGGKCSLQTRRRSSTYRLSCVRELISITRVQTIDARSPPDVGRLRLVVRQLVPVLRHRQHPHSAERGNHRDIHDDPHGLIPCSHSGRIASPCQSSGREREILRVWLSGN